MLAGGMEMTFNTQIIQVAQIVQIQQQLEKAEEVITGRMARINKAVGSATAAFNEFALVMDAAMALGKWVKSGIDAADELGNLAKKIGMATESAAGLQLAFELGGGSAQDLEKTMVGLSGAIANGNAGLKALHIDTKNADGSLRSNEAVLADVADAFQAMGSGAERTSLAVQIFGARGAAMIPVLDEGAKGLSEMHEKAVALGLAISADVAKQAGDFNEKLDLLGKGVQGAAMSVGVQLLPMLEYVAGAFGKSMQEGGLLHTVVERLAIALKALSTVGMIVGQVFVLVGKAMNTPVAAMSALLSGGGSLAERIARAQQVVTGTMKSAADDLSEAFMATKQMWTGERKAEEKATDPVKTAKAVVPKASSPAKSAALAAPATPVPAQPDIAAKIASETSAIEAQVRALELEKNVRGELASAQTAYAMEMVRLELLEDTLGAKAIQALEAKLAALGRLKEAQEGKENKAKVDKAAEEKQAQADNAARENKEKAKNAADELNKLLEPGKASAFGDALKAAFGGAGDALGKLLVQLEAYGDQQKEIDEARGKVAVAYKTEAERSRALQAINEKDMRQRVSGYADLAGAAKGFFKENSAGYKALQTVEKAFHAFEMALVAQSMIKRLMATEATTTAAVAGKAAETVAAVGNAVADTAATGIAVGNSEARTAASTAAGVAKAFEQMGVYGFAGAAAILAFMAAFNSSGMSGGGGAAATTFEDRQKKQGTGTVLGDDSAKSESIAKSLEIVERNSGLELNYQGAMLAALKGIESALGGAAKGLFQTAGVTSGSAFGTSNVATKSFFGADTSTTITDSGIRFSGALGQLGNGAGKAEQYEDVVKRSDGGWFHGNKEWKVTNTKALEDAALKPFTLLFGHMSSLLVAAGVKLGADGEQLANTVSQALIDFSVSTRELKGQDLVDALSAGISVAFDKVTAELFPQVVQFQRVGEGLGETLTRLASNSAALDSVLNGIGMTFGASGLAGTAARERLIDLAGGIDEMSKQAGSFAENYLSEAERLAPVTKYVSEQMAALGLSSIATRDAFKDQVLALDLTTDAGARQYAALMKLQEAFAKVHPAIEDTAGAVQSIADIADQRKGLMDELRQLERDAMSPDALLKLRRSEVAGSNHDVFDQLEAAKAAKALADINQDFKRQVEELEKAALPLAEQRAREVQGMDATTLKLYERREQLQAEAKAAADATAAGKAAADKAAQDTRTARDKLTAAYDGEKNAIQATIDKLASLARNLRGFRDSLLLGDQSPLTPLQKYQQAQAQYEKTLAQARTGDADAQSKVTGAAQAFLEASRTVNASDGQYQADFMRVLRQAEDMAQWAEAGIDKEQASLDALNQQVQGLLEIRNGVLSVADAIRNLQAAMETEAATTPRSATVEALYQAMLGRASDKAGLAYWVDRLEAGATAAQVAAAMAASDEYADQHGLSRSPARLGGAAPEDGAPVLDYSAMGTQGMASLVTEIKALRADGQAMRTTMEAQAGELRALRADQQRQTGDIINSTYDANARAAQTVADGVGAAARGSAYEQRTMARLE